METLLNTAIVFAFFFGTGSVVSYFLGKNRARYSGDFRLGLAFALIFVVFVQILLIIPWENPSTREMMVVASRGLAGFWFGLLFGFVMSFIIPWRLERIELREKLEAEKLKEQRKAKAEEIKMEKKALGIAKKYGGVLTKTILFEVGNFSLDEGENILRTFLQHKIARRLDFDGMEVYDISSVRVHLSTIHQAVMEEIIRRHGRVKRTELFSVMKLSMDSLEEALKGLEKFGYITYDPASDEYRLKGMV